MTKFARMLDVLDLYSEQDTLLTAEEIAQRLDVSRTTAFRYARELSELGFLANYGGRYSLGARIITLDYRIRLADPVLQAAQGIMQQITAETTISTFLCRMYNEQVIHVHHEDGYEKALVSFGRGRPLPLFRGAASKMLMACVPPRRLRRIYERYAADPDVRRIASDWEGFNAFYRDIRKQGYYVSAEEVDPGLVGLAAPVFVPGAGTVAALCLVMTSQRLGLLNVDGVATMLKERAREVSEKLRELGIAAEETAAEH